MLAQSIEEIRQEAIKKGIEEGIEKGHKDILEIAKRMLLEGCSVEKIASLTELSGEEIRKPDTEGSLIITPDYLFS